MSNKIISVAILTVVKHDTVKVARDFVYLSIWVSLSKKPFRNKTRLRQLPLVPDQHDWVERTTASQLQWSNLALLRPHGWRRLPRRKAGCIASSINKPLATKEVDAVNICPGTVALGRAPRVFILPTLSLPLLWTGPAARGLRGARGRCSGMMRFCKHGSQTWNEISLLSLPCWGRRPHLTLSERLAAPPLRPSSAQACLSFSEMDRWSWAL